MTIPTRKADSRRSGYSPGLDSFQAIFPGTVFRFARRCQKSVITRYDTAIPLYQGLARSFGYKAKTLIKIQIVSLSAILFASVQVCGYHNTKGKNVLSWLQLCGVVTKRHFTFGKRFAGSPALVYVPTDFDTIEKALSRANAAEKA